MYEDFMNGLPKFPQKYLWKLKIPLKIKILMWFLYKKVLLTNANLAKRKWKGSKKCCFCDSEKTIEHLFLFCPFAKMVWRIVHISFALPPPISVSNMFGNWLYETDKKTKAKIRIGISALCWSIWTCRNNFVFNHTRSFNFLQVIHMVAHWIQLWAFLLPADQQEYLVTGCNQLLTVASDFSSLGGCRHSSRLDFG